MTKINILFVCSANEDRSRTAEDLYKIHPRLEVKSAGVDWNVKKRVTEGLIKWADVVLCMEEFQINMIMKEFGNLIPGKIIDYLDIEANYAILQNDPPSFIKARVDTWLSKNLNIV